MSVLAVLAAYLVGAVPIGWLVARAFGLSDLRRHGSGNIGATNVLRTLGRVPAVLTLLADVGKGTWRWCWAPRCRAVSRTPSPRPPGGGRRQLLVGLPGFPRRQGCGDGPGGLAPHGAAGHPGRAAVFLAVVATTRYVSLGSLLAAACVPLGAVMPALSRRLCAGGAGGGHHRHRAAPRQYRSSAGRHRIPAGAARGTVRALREPRLVS